MCGSSICNFYFCAKLFICVHLWSNIDVALQNKSAVVLLSLSSSEEKFETKCVTYSNYMQNSTHLC